MRERPYLDERSEFVTAGVLAEDVVFAASGLKRGRRPNKNDARALGVARDLLAFIATPEVDVNVQQRVGSLTGSAGALEALRVVESQTPAAEVRRFLEELIKVIDASLAGEDVSARTPVLDALQKLFAAIGNVALARSNSLSATAEGRHLWRRATTILAS